MSSYVVVGDSQAEGLLFRVALPAKLGDRLAGGYDHRGWSTSRLLREGAIGEAADAALARNAKLLIFSGGNDNDVLATPANLDRYKNTLLDVVGALARKSAAAGRPLEVVWFGPVFARIAPDSEQHPATAQAMRTILATSEAQARAREGGSRLSVRWVDSQPLTRDLAREENVHLTSDGYGTFADRVLNTVEGAGAAAAGAGFAVAVFVGGLGYWLWTRSAR